MLKHLALGLFLASAASPALAQTAPAAAPAAAGQYQYCNLLGFGTQGRNARLEYGQHSKSPVGNPELEALDEKVKNLDSAISALNYLTSSGWEYVSVTALSPGDTSYIVYLLRRRTP
jgi:hypothetical protein